MRLTAALFFLFITTSCIAQKQHADLLVFNATIYTVDASFSTANAMVIQEGRIAAIGKLQDIERSFTTANRFDAKGRFIYPGFIDAHAHFVEYASVLQTADLVGTGSWEEIIKRLQAFAADHKDGWLIGRGWDQNDWSVKEFPVNDKLNELFPDRPVLLTRIDGHAALVNQPALSLAGIQAGDTLTGGLIETKGGRMTGILIDNAINLVSEKIPGLTADQFKVAMQDAEKNCFAAGLTTVDDCGLKPDDVEAIQQLQTNGQLKMRLYAMLSDQPSSYAYLEKKGIIKTERLHVRGFKVYGDGALGSRGACLIQPYADKPGHFGFLLSRPEHFDSVANWISQKGFQMCTHAIGDSGNRTILDIYAKYLKGPNDRRWRIEHAQVINRNDFDKFGKFSIIPSVQPTHATSDMYWAQDRLGADRLKGAYAYRQLLSQNQWLPLGTDFPVEDISPIRTFYAAVVRKDAKGWPAKGFQPENALSREDALRGMTIWAAKSNFEEKEKGSLEPGKVADFVITDKDLLKAGEKELLSIQVLRTYLGGEAVFIRK